MGSSERFWNKERLKMGQEVLTKVKGKHLEPGALESLNP